MKSLLLVALVLALGCGSSGDRVVVGSKNFTEQRILGELLAQTREQAEQALVQAEAEEKSLTEEALSKASEQGEAEAAETLAVMEREADDLCGKAKAKLDGAVRYLVDKVQSRA